ncbi:zeta toxin family protein [Oceanobacillus luteolus]|uniref:UDP-N-acetylglucosamine kinase n=1 Tax=Oceanobacillus luteolus TaxID=1274358 RepID=A0ABW4HS98_9BACI
MGKERDEAKKTKNIHRTNDGDYTEDRKKVHSQIINYYLKLVESHENEELEAILLGGGSNSGKSTIIEELELDDFITIDSDEIKQHLPEYEEYQRDEPEMAAFFVHDESSDISHELLNKSIALVKPFLYDGTMKNTEKYREIIKELREKNYFITMIVVDVPVDLAFQRNRARFEATGRAVPDHIVTETHDAIPNSFSELKNLVDEYYLYDTRNGYAILVANKTVDDGEVVHDEALYHEFLNKGKK